MGKKKFKMGDKVKIGDKDRQVFYSCIKLTVFRGKFIKYSPTGGWAEVVFDGGSTRAVLSKDLEPLLQKGEQLLFEFME